MIDINEEIRKSIITWYDLGDYDKIIKLCEVRKMMDDIEEKNDDKAKESWKNALDDTWKEFDDLNDFILILSYINTIFHEEAKTIFVDWIKMTFMEGKDE